MQRDILTLMKRHEVPAAIAEEYNDQFQNQFTKGG